MRLISRDSAGYPCAVPRSLRTEPFSASQDLEELVRSAAAGDRGAQQDLMSRYWPVIRYAVRARKSRLGTSLAAREETQDLDQAAAMRVLTGIAKHEWRGRSAFTLWVKTLSAAEVVDAYRRHRAQKRDVAADTGESKVGEDPRLRRSMESLVEDSIEVRKLLDDLGELKSEYAAALLMHHLGFSHAEVGDSLDCSADAARKLVARARTTLLRLRQRRST
jgi:RNA polymerase sigma factor (sigma-70 family)